MALVSAPRPRRRSLSELPEIRFSWRDDRLHWSLSERPAYTTANHFVLIVPPPPPDRREPTAVYLHPTGEPVDDRSRHWLLRDASDYLTVLTGRRYVEPTPPSGVESIPTDPAEFARWFNDRNPEELPDLPRFDADDELLETLRKGGGTKEAWDAYAVRYSTRERSHRHPLEMAPSDWNGFVERRVSFLVGRPRHDPMVAGMIAAICEAGTWEEYLPPQALEEFRGRYLGDETFRRRLHVLLQFTHERIRHAEWKQVLAETRRRTLASGRRKVTFVFPSDRDPKRPKPEATRLFLLATYVGLHQRALRRALPAHCAAATFEARHYVVTPKRIARPELTQDDAAAHFEVSRRQLQVALREIRESDYTDRIFHLAYRRRLHEPQVKRRQ